MFLQVKFSRRPHPIQPGEFALPTSSAWGLPTFDRLADDIRRHRLLLLFLAVSLLLLTACGHAPKSQQTMSQETSCSTSVQDKLLHYWDNFPYDDMTALSDTAWMQDMLGNWLQAMSQLPEGEARTYAGLSITAGQGKTEGQQALFHWLETLLNDPNSPWRNEELFIPVLEAMTQDALLSELDKERPRFLLAQALKNRKGTQAADIALITREGERVWLYGIQCEEILLYFFNPDCHDCKRVSDWLMKDPELNDRQRQGRLQIVAIYPDEDLASWDAMGDSYPANWIIGRSPTEKEQSRFHLPAIKERYHLPAIPSVYILDTSHIVLAKDVML